MSDTITHLTGTELRRTPTPLWYCFLPQISQSFPGACCYALSCVANTLPIFSPCVRAYVCNIVTPNSIEEIWQLTWNGQENRLNSSAWNKTIAHRKRGWLLTWWLRLIWSEAHVTMTTQSDQSQFCERQPNWCQLPPHETLAEPQAILLHPKHMWASPAFPCLLYGQTSPSQLMRLCPEQEKTNLRWKGREGGWHSILATRIPGVHWSPSEWAFV